MGNPNDTAANLGRDSGGVPSARQRIRIMIVDDHPVVRFGLMGLLSMQPDLEVIGEASSCGEACEKVRLLRPDLVILDLEMGDTCGADALSKVRETYPQLPTIVFTAHDNDWRIVEAVRIGLQGYLVKGTPPEVILEAVRVVSRGEFFIDPKIASKVLGQIGRKVERRSPNSRVLTDRERSVLQLLAQGKRNKEISEALFISERTVKFHMSAVMKKLHATNRTEAVRIAAARGLVSL